MSANITPPSPSKIWIGRLGRDADMKYTEDATMGRPRGVQELTLAMLESGIQPGTHVVHDGWRATIALDWEALQMTHTVVNHRQGEIVVYDPDTPSPGELCFSTTNHIEAKWSSLKRWMRGKCGGKMPKVGAWGGYIREYQWRKWFAGPILPLLVDHTREHYSAALNR